MTGRRKSSSSRFERNRTEDQDKELSSITLSGKDPSIWKSLSPAFFSRIRNLIQTVASLETFKRRSVGGELNRMIHAAIESAHAVLDSRAAKNEKLRAEAEAALAKAELDRVRAENERRVPVAELLLEKQARHTEANRRVQRWVARGEFTAYEEDGEVIFVYSKTDDKDRTNDDEPDGK